MYNQYVFPGMTACRGLEVQRAAGGKGTCYQTVKKK